MQASKAENRIRHWGDHINSEKIDVEIKKLEAHIDMKKLFFPSESAQVNKETYKNVII